MNRVIAIQFSDSGVTAQYFLCCEMHNKESFACLSEAAFTASIDLKLFEHFDLAVVSVSALTAG